VRVPAKPAPHAGGDTHAGQARSKSLEHPLVGHHNHPRHRPLLRPRNDPQQIPGEAGEEPPDRFRVVLVRQDVTDLRRGPRAVRQIENPPQVVRGHSP
jgi:hypothetical protein